MEYCVGVSIETVLQIVKSHFAVNGRMFLKTDVSNCRPHSLRRRTTIRNVSFKTLFHHGVKLNYQ